MVEDPGIVLEICGVEETVDEQFIVDARLPVAEIFEETVDKQVIVLDICGVAWMVEVAFIVAFAGKFPFDVAVTVDVLAIVEISSK